MVGLFSKGMFELNWKIEYDRWHHFADLDDELKNELLNITDETQLEDCFYKDLEFGTGGMRGELGVGTNRLNIYTIRKATQGLANYIKDNGSNAIKKGVVIAYDSRHKSPEFALEVAKVLATNGITAYLFDSLRATPVLSFAVRHLNAFSGIVLTASHNPPEYNGYKVYGEDGGQLPPEAANKLVTYVNKVPNELLVNVAELTPDQTHPLIKNIGSTVDEAYLKNLKNVTLQPEMVSDSGQALSIVFSPLHGTSRIMIQEGLKNIGFSNVTTVKEQEMPDPNFSTVKSPNPEEHDAFSYAIRYGEELNADILLATDPDADRLGVAVKNPEGEYVVLTGNQTGALMLEYLLSQKKILGTLPRHGMILKTIVTSEIGRVIGENYGIDTLDTLTGFKFIGEKIEAFSSSGEYDFQFGYEESYGYLLDDFVRDKDAIQGAVFACEVALYYKLQNKTLYDGLMEIFEKYGYFYEDLHALTLKGIAGVAQIKRIMNHFRETDFTQFADFDVEMVEDYQFGVRKIVGANWEEKIDLPNSNVLKYHLSHSNWFCLRPSGTEPKIKFYFGTKDTATDAALKNISKMKTQLLKMVDDVINH